MPHHNKTIYWTKLKQREGTLHLAATPDGLCFVSPYNEDFTALEAWVKKHLPLYTLIEDEKQLTDYTRELSDYLRGKRQYFTVPLDLHGTSFQQTVWEELQQIPYGKTVSYSEIAQKIQRPTAVRAVGTAIGANPLLIIIPCHRVIAKSGKLSGFRGGIEMKEQLLGLEQ